MISHLNNTHKDMLENVDFSEPRAFFKLDQQPFKQQIYTRANCRVHFLTFLKTLFMEDIEITILPEDFDIDYEIGIGIYARHPQYNNPYDCPLARAIKRQMGIKEVGIGGHGSDIRLKGHEYLYNVSYKRWDSEASTKVFYSKEPYSVTLVPDMFP